MGAYDKYIWGYFHARIENDYGVAGLMGNLFAESALNPKNLQGSYETSLGFTDDSYTAAVDSGAYTRDQFINDSAGYGLAQWTYWSRKQGMYDFWKAGGYDSIGSIYLACDYLYFELVNSYPSVLRDLKNASSIREASDTVLHDFEKPKNQSEEVELKRLGYSEGYYNTYAGSSPDPDVPVDPDPDEPEEPDTPTTPAKRHAMSLLMLLIATRKR